MEDEGGYYEEFMVDSHLIVEAQLGLEYVDEIFDVCKSMEKKYHSRQCILNQPLVSRSQRMLYLCACVYLHSV